MTSKPQSRPVVWANRWAEVIQDHPVVWAFGVTSGIVFGLILGWAW